MSLIRWKPKNQNLFDEFFNFDYPFFGSSLIPRFDRILPSRKDSWLPAVDVSEDKDNVYVKADLPGLKKEDIFLNIEGKALTIHGERKIEKEQKAKNYYRTERSCGIFERTLDLGSNVDPSKIKATYKNGVLEIIVPKTEESKSQKIEIGE